MADDDLQEISPQEAADTYQDQQQDQGPEQPEQQAPEDLEEINPHEAAALAYQGGQTTQPEQAQPDILEHAATTGLKAAGEAITQGASDIGKAFTEPSLENTGKGVQGLISMIGAPFAGISSAINDAANTLAPNLNPNMKAASEKINKFIPKQAHGLLSSQFPGFLAPESIGELGANVAGVLPFLKGGKGAALKRGLTEVDNIGSGDPAVRAAMAGEQPNAGPGVQEGPTTADNVAQQQARQQGPPAANENAPFAENAEPLSGPGPEPTVQPTDRRVTTGITQDITGRNANNNRQRGGVRSGPEEPPPETAQPPRYEGPSAEQQLRDRLAAQKEAEPPEGGLEEITPREAQEAAQERPNLGPIAGEDEGLLEASRAQREAAAGAVAKAKEGQLGEAFQPRPLRKGRGFEQAQKGGPESFEVEPQAMARKKMGGTKSPEETLKAIEEKGGLEAVKKLEETPEDLKAAERAKDEALAEEIRKAMYPTGKELDAQKSFYTKGLNKVARPWHMLMSPEHLTSTNGLLDNKIRGAQGVTNQQRYIYNKATAPARKIMNRLSPQHNEDLLRAFQEGDLPADHPLRDLIGDTQPIHQDYMRRLAERDPEGNWHDSMLPQMFEEPLKAKQFIQDRRDLGKSGNFTLGEIADGNNELGKIPLRKELLHPNGSPDIVKTIQTLHNGYDHFLEGKRILDQSLRDGTISKVQRTSDDVPINGITSGGGQLWAEPDVALMWNRYFVPKIIDPVSGHFLDSVQRVKNMGTAYQLFGGAYHFLAETTEAVNGDVMSGLAHLFAGRPDLMLAKFAKAPFAPLRQATLSASKLLKEYENPGSAKDPVTQKAVRALVEGGFSPERIQRYTPDLTSAAKDWIDMIKEAGLRTEFKEKGQRIGQAFTRNGLKGAYRGPKQMAAESWKLTAEAMQTMMRPLFKTYIPRLKTGAALEQMSEYIRMNPNESANTYQEIAKRISKSIDDRLGEMNQSTLYWHLATKRAANALMISPSWEAGNVRAIPGGMMNIIRNPKSLSIRGKNYQPNANFPLAFAITTGLFTALATAIKGGDPIPRSIKDIWQSRDAEGNRFINPGYQKDVWQAYKILYGDHKGIGPELKQAAYDKLSLVPKTAWDLMGNQDWREDQLYNPSQPGGDKMAQFLEYLRQNAAKPIGFSSLEKEAPGLSGFEKFIGIKKAPSIYEEQQVKNYQQQDKAERDRAKQRGEEPPEKIERPPEVQEMEEEMKQKQRERYNEAHPDRSHKRKSYEEGGIVEGDSGSSDSGSSSSQDYQQMAQTDATSAPDSSGQQLDYSSIIQPVTSSTDPSLVTTTDLQGLKQDVNQLYTNTPAFNHRNQAQIGAMFPNTDWNKFESQATPSQNVEDVRPIPGSEQLGSLGGVNVGKVAGNIGSTVSKWFGGGGSYAQGGPVRGPVPRPEMQQPATTSGGLRRGGVVKKSLTGRR